MGVDRLIEKLQANASSNIPTSIAQNVTDGRSSDPAKPASSISSSSPDLTKKPEPAVDGVADSSMPTINEVKTVTINGKKVFTKMARNGQLQDRSMLDRDWAKNAFMLRGYRKPDGGSEIVSSSLKDIDFENTSYSAAYFNFEDTSPGGNRCINPRPQYTPYADPPMKGLMYGIKDASIYNFSGQEGMGRFYYESIQSTQQLVYFRFGKPMFNSLTTFFSGFYNNSVARMVRTGRQDDFIYNWAKTAGKVIGIAAQVILWPITATLIVGRLAKWAMGMDSSRFYTFKPTMFNYWATVNVLMNTIAVNNGLVPTFIKDMNSKSQKDQRVNEAYSIDKEHLQVIQRLLPSIFNDNGMIDMYSVATRAQRRYQALSRAQNDAYNSSSATDFYGYVKKDIFKQTQLENPPGSGGFFGMLNRYLNTSIYKSKDPDNNSISLERDPRTLRGDSPAKDKKVSEPIKSEIDETFANYFEAEMNDGSAFVCFRVDNTGSSSESFSNSVGESEIQSQFNKKSSDARSAMFNFADGNIDDGVLGKLVGGIASAAKGMLDGVLDSMHISGLMSLAGNAFVDIPKYWQSSSANLPRASYTIDCVSPYGNTISRMINMYMPLVMLLAGALPQSTGRQSWGSPYICQFYDQSRGQSRLAMIDSLSVERGTNNLAFNRAQNAMGLRLSFSVVDLSSVIHIPISTGPGSVFEIFGVGNTGSGIFDDETAFHDYMAVLGGLGLYEQFNKWPSGLLRAARAAIPISSRASPAIFSMILHEKTPVGWFDVMYKGGAAMSGKFANATTN